MAPAIADRATTRAEIPDEIMLRPHVRVGSQAEVTALIFDICITPNIRHSFDRSARRRRANSGHSRQMLETRPSGSPQGLIWINVALFLQGDDSRVSLNLHHSGGARRHPFHRDIHHLCVAGQVPPPSDRDFVVRDFHFLSGETMPELRIHYRTLGKATVDASGRTTNAVLLLHGTGASGRQFLERSFSDVLFGRNSSWILIGTS